ncbi:DUF2975 domain-containing protein [Sporolactobacillus vineae]|uniref:DUF2975 domain-containing protein n=1 Tax=Sporolactobacillus vineae TaxID=444463 RepID=UPI0002889EBD|nr:DUF2975 domain-containing protein [Sporolactobacillus vineae]
MKILDQNGLSGLVNGLLHLILLGGAVIFVSLPWSVKWYMNVLPYESSENYAFLLAFFAITGLFALTIVYELIRIFRTLNRHDPFQWDNVHSLRKIAVASFLIAAGYIVKMIFFNSFLTVILVMVFVIAGFFSIILAEVFRQAVIVKEENDLTI